MNASRTSFGKRIPLWSCLVLAWGVASACYGPAPTPADPILPMAQPAELGMDPAPLGEIEAHLGEFVVRKEIAGSVTLVARQGRVVHLAAVGHADLEQRRVMQPDTLFAVASMTKPVTAVALMILADEGKISLDDPVVRYLPELEGLSLDTGPPKTPITIRHLLTHTSGLGGSQQNQGSIQRTVELLAGEPLRFEPGTGWQYGPGLTVCGRVVEVVSGQPFERFLEERIFSPLGMVDTTFFPTADQQGRLATIYQPAGDAGSLEPTTHWLSELTPERTPNPSGGLFSTATDMARFYQMVLDGGQLGGLRLLSQEAVREMTAVQTGDLTTGFTEGNGWGLGWCVIREPQGVTAMLSPGSYGHGGLFGTQGWVDPDKEMIFVLLIQRLGFGNSDASEIRRVFQELAVQALEARRPASARSW